MRAGHSGSHLKFQHLGEDQEGHPVLLGKFNASLGYIKTEFPNKNKQTTLTDLTLPPISWDLYTFPQNKNCINMSLICFLHTFYLISLYFFSKWNACYTSELELRKVAGMTVLLPLRAHKHLQQSWMQLHPEIHAAYPLRSSSENHSPFPSVNY